MDARDDAEVVEAPGAECSANIVVPWAIQEYRRVLDGLDDDAILNCTVISQTKTAEVFKSLSRAFWFSAGIYNFSAFQC